MTIVINVTIMNKWYLLKGVVDMEYVECPGCGCKIPPEYVDYLDNGNPACSACVSKERQKDDEKTQENKDMK